MCRLVVAVAVDPCDQELNARELTRRGLAVRLIVCVAAVALFALAGGGVEAARAYSGSISPGGSPVTVAFVPDEVAEITFSGFAGQRVSLTMDGSMNTGGCVANFWIRKPLLPFDFVDRSYGSAGSCIWGGNGGPVGSGNGFIGPLTLPETGTYTITFDPWGGTLGDPLCERCRECEREWCAAETRASADSGGQG